MPKPKQPRKTTTLESAAFLDGLFGDFDQQRFRYHQLTAHVMGVEAQLELAEKTLILTRDHLKMALDNSDESEDRAAFMKRWKEDSRKVRFVGVRLVDACTAVIKEKRKITPEKLLDEVNNGTFRFRTNAPLREIHAALLRHPHVKREENFYIWNAPEEEQIKMNLRISRGPGVVETPGKIIEGEVKPN
jgi:hypothetical protein